MEAVQGCTKTITFQAPLTCQGCGTCFLSIYLMSLSANLGFFCPNRNTIYKLLIPAFTFCVLAGGTGVPPGTKPENCRRCGGAGEVLSDGNMVVNLDSEKI